MKNKVNINGFKNIYFLGIAGIGMSALARWFKAWGYNVAGYDRDEGILARQLIKEDIDVHFKDDINNIPYHFSKDNTLVVYTPAIPYDHSEFNYFKENDFYYYKRAVVLGKITENHFTIAVAGTHGKTTTASLIAHLLYQAGKNTAAFIGGIANNFNSNVLIPEKVDSNTILVVEADEYDRSFFNLYPDIGIITSIDPDHLDIYGEVDNVKAAFAEFASQIHKNGTLICNKSIELDFNHGILLTYGLEEGDLIAENIRAADGRFIFNVSAGAISIQDLKLKVPGYHNVENSLAAIAVALNLNIAHGSIKNAIYTYQGVKRRFDFIIHSGERIFIDDYAHHPKEISALLSSVRKLFPDKKLTAVFQPHLYSRTLDFADEFAESLSKADQVILLDIYPAREKPIEGVTVDMILEKVRVTDKFKVSKEMLPQLIEENDPELLLTMGAGDISYLVQDIKQRLLKKNLIEV